MGARKKNRIYTLSRFQKAVLDQVSLMTDVRSGSDTTSMATHVQLII